VTLACDVALFLQSENNVSCYISDVGRRLKTRSHENQILAASPVQLNSTMTARLDLSCLLGRGLLKAPDLPNTSGAKYARYVYLIYCVHRTEAFFVSY
jgi:hypothetical protein